jgi:DNA-binding MarR family transcriptional regulator
VSPAATASAASARADALDGVGRSFKATLAAVRRLRGRDTHRPERLSHAQYSVLFELARNQPRSLRDLALDADLSAATVTQMLDAMAADGLVERVRCEHDKRVVLTSLTTRGEALVAERRALYEPLWREALERFSDDELLTAAAVLESLGEMFGELGS